MHSCGQPTQLGQNTTDLTMCASPRTTSAIAARDLLAEQSRQPRVAPVFAAHGHWTTQEHTQAGMAFRTRWTGMSAPSKRQLPGWLDQLLRVAAVVYVWTRPVDTSGSKLRR